ncbi:MAG TPA: undecaprenyl-diphosphate phosphatase, partial [Tepidisphaeraceae bacterium]|nr:undecaprenyl-diphosphate phosphatase [Tepidisphaeraceae bacterium]
QLGAILSVVVYFWKRLLSFARTFPKGEDGTRTIWTHPLSMVAIATIVTIGPCYLIDKKIGENLENEWVIGWALIIGGLVMWAIDVIFRKPKIDSIHHMKLWHAIVIGAAQIVAAAFPGTSRSMATIAAGQVVGMARSPALEFSFFLSIPIMFAATGFKLFQYVFSNEAAPPMDSKQWGVLALGFAVSFVVALVVIHWFMGWVRKRGFAPFAIYRILIGIFTLLMAAGAFARSD